MSIFVMGDQPTCEAFELIGVAGSTPEAGASIEEAIVRLLDEHQEAELVLVQSSLVDGVSEVFLEETARSRGCLVVAVPSPGESPPDPASYLREVRSAFGGSG